MMAISATTWRRSSRSSGNGGACVEVARTRDVVLIRDSKHPAGGRLELPIAVFNELLASIKDGRTVI